MEGLIFGGGLSTEGNLRLKIDWASLINGRKFTVFSLFYFVFEGNFRVQAPRGAHILRADLTKGFLLYEFGGLIHGGAYFGNFTVTVDRPVPRSMHAHRDVVKCIGNLFDLIKHLYAWQHQCL